MLEALHAAEKLQDFFGAENDGQLLRLLGRRDNFFECPVLVQSYFIQKTKRSHSGQYGTGRQLLFVSQIQLVSPDILRRYDFRRLTEMTCEKRDLLHVGSLGMR